MNANAPASSFIPVCLSFLLAFSSGACCHVNHLTIQGPPVSVVVESSVTAAFDVELTKRRSSPGRAIVGSVAAATPAEHQYLRDLSHGDPNACIPYLNRAVSRGLEKRLGWKVGERGDLLSIEVDELRLVAPDAVSPFEVVGSMRVFLNRGKELVWRDCLDFEMPADRESVKSLGQLPAELRQRFWKRLAEQIAATVLQGLLRDQPRADPRPGRSG